MKQGTFKRVLLSKDLEKFRSEELTSLYNDPQMGPYLKELGVSVELVIEYLDIFLDISDDFHYCASCPGLDECKKKNPRMLVKPYIDGDYIERKLTICPKMAQKRALERKFIVRDFNDEWVGKSIRNKKDFDITESRKAIVTRYLLALQKESFSWIYLYGGTRLGKSYMTAAFIQTLLSSKEGTTCAFLDCSTRIKELNDLSFTDKVAFNDLLKQYMNVDYLVLDDFGNEYKNEYIRDTIIYPLLSYRAKENKPVYFTSHYSVNEIVTLYSITAAGKIKARQLGDLIKAMAQKEIHLEGVKVY